ncbi:hypothetical protein WAI453_006728 [Rhynchosporium graminicola]
MTPPCPPDQTPHSTHALGGDFDVIYCPDGTNEQFAPGWHNWLARGPFKKNTLHKDQPKVESSSLSSGGSMSLCTVFFSRSEVSGN